MSNNNNYNFENEKKLSIKELREQMHSSEDKELEDGIYPAYLAEISIQQDVETKYGLTDRIHFTFTVYAGSNEVTEVHFSYLRAEGVNSQIGNIASDFGAILNIMPGNVALKQIFNGFFDLDISRVEEPTVHYFINSILPYTGDEEVSGRLMDKKQPSESLEDKFDGSYTLLRKQEPREVVPDGTYFASIEACEYAVASNGNHYVRLTLTLLTEEGNRLIRANLFKGQRPYKKLMTLLDSYESEEDNFLDLDFKVEVHSSKVGDNIYYDIDDIVIASTDDDVTEGGDFYEV